VVSAIPTVGRSGRPVGVTEAAVGILRAIVALYDESPVDAEGFAAIRRADIAVRSGRSARWIGSAVERMAFLGWIEARPPIAHGPQEPVAYNRYRVTDAGREWSAKLSG
jgi:hypothetical protein